MDSYRRIIDFCRPIFSKAFRFLSKNSQKTIGFVLVAVSVVLVFAIRRTIRTTKAQIESYRVPEVIYLPKEQVKDIREFMEVQKQIDSLETIKTSLQQNIYHDPKIDIQQKLNLIFNNK